MFADHFEPKYDVDRTRAWIASYARLAARHRDSAGRPLQHTWFYPGEQADAQILEHLRQATAMGLGEVELHYHHGRDTAATLRAGLRESIAQFRLRYGHRQLAGVAYARQRATRFVELAGGRYARLA